MQGLLLRLSTLDADAESAVRVIAYFDSLVRDHVAVPTLLTATARLAQCPVGLYDAATGRRTRATPDGRTGPPGTAPDTAPGTATGEGVLVRRLACGLGAVWIEREGPPHGLDEIVLERYAAAAEVTLERAAALVRAGQDPALVELVLSAETGETERARALRLLGFDPAAPLCALAVAPPAQGHGRSRPPEAGPAAGLRAMGHHVRTAAIGDIQAVLVTPTVPQVTTPAVTPAQGTGPDVLGPRLERLAAAGDGARVGVGPELPGARAAESWAGARTALRFTGPHDRVIRWSELGALALFADLPEQAIAELDDVRAMSRLSDESLQAIRALCQAGSIRGAAAALHLHHSSLAARVARAESVLGFSPAEPSGRLRAHLALALLRLLANTGAGHHRPGASPV
ncbi:PucR family transcriptional regulator [Nonomuraea sp. NPDC049309]|uniref:PucR family transcriptional regulator n=1 Tax=Nonomuraea sp. NPDC049309 TaxID=3364350 RepID=UPI003719A362